MDTVLYLVGDDFACDRLQLIAEGKLNLSTINNSSLEVEKMKIKSLRNNIVISILGVVIFILLVF